MELTTEDKQRIYTIAHKKYSDPFENIDRREGYMEGYKDATTFERENRQSSNDGLNDRIKELELERTSLKNKVYKKKIEKLEAERSELLERVSSLTKERQEMVEALRQRVFSFGKLLSIDEREFLQSLLSKFEP